MLSTKPRFQTFAEYLQYEDNSEGLYELFNGELIEMPPESGLNYQIANRLFLVFALMLGTDRIRGHGLELEVRGEPKNRYPDLTIIREEHIQLFSQRNTILLAMAPPLLVLEVVSPGEIQRERDYIAKRIQYQDCGITEYWIVDPIQDTLDLYVLQNNKFQHKVQIEKKGIIPSEIFPGLDLDLERILQ